jgi:pterin-4a-carbinolamine dehydratase
MQSIVIMHTEVKLRRPPRRPQPPEEELKPERVQEELAAMPEWELLAGGKSIGRSFRFASERAAVTYAAFVSSTAVDAGQPVRLLLDGRRLEVKLFSPPSRNGSRGELTMEVLDFARKMS